MSALLYRGKTYEPHHEAAPKACRVLNYHQQHYNTCREKTQRDLHPHLSYRGVAYVKDQVAPVITTAEARSRNDRQAYFSITRDLAEAQFKLADDELSRRLWDDVGERELDVERINNLLYGCTFHDDDAAMQEADEAYLKGRKG